MKHTAFFLLIVILSACSGAADEPQWSTAVLPATIDPADTVMANAQRNYESYCAHCHGYAGDGQGAASEERTLSLGYKPVPRHDSEGHTWQHPDQLLFETIKYGVNSPLNLYVMSPHGDRLNDDEIMAIVQYLKRFWTDEQRTFQARLTADFAELQPDWESYHLDD